MAYTKVSVGLFTYFVVLDINHLATACRDRYSGYRSNVIEQMKNDRRWADCAGKFDKGRGHTGSLESKPSEWFVLVYWIIEACKSWYPRRPKEQNHELPVRASGPAKRRSNSSIPSINTGAR